MPFREAEIKMGKDSIESISGQMLFYDGIFGNSMKMFLK